MPSTVAAVTFVTCLCLSSPAVPNIFSGGTMGIDKVIPYLFEYRSIFTSKHGVYYWNNLLIKHYGGPTLWAHSTCLQIVGRPSLRAALRVRGALLVSHATIVILTHEQRPRRN